MGEKAHLPKENGLSQGEKPEPAENSDNETAEDADDMSSEDFQMLDNQLDALNSALDDIEQKNDNIHAQLLELLQSNREIRQQIQESNAEEPQGAPGQS